MRLWENPIPSSRSSFLSSSPSLPDCSLAPENLLHAPFLNRQTTLGMSASLPLHGIRVVELTTTVAGPSCGAMLADFGAEVIKVEPPRGDSFRYALANLGAAKSASPLLSSPAFYGINRGKQSVSLDLDKRHHRDALFALILTADVFLTNARQQQLRGWGLDATNLYRRFPKLVVCALTGFGLVGEERNAPGYDVGCFFARSGAASESTV